MASLGVFSLFRRRLPGSGLFSLLMFAGAEIAVLYSFEIACVSLPWKFLFLKLQFFGTTTLTVLWFLVAAYFCGFRRLLSLKYILPLFIVPFITIVIAWTNNFHFLFWREIGVGEIGGVIYLDNSYGYWYWVHLFYTYTMFIIGSILLIGHALRSKGLRRSQSIAFLISAVFPWILNVLFSIDVFKWAVVDISPISFTITGTALWWAIFRYHLLDIMPAAKDMLLENMRLGIIVTDLENHIVEVNGFIRRIFSFTSSNIVGQQSHIIWNELNLNSSDDLNKKEIFYKGRTGEYYFEIDKNPITNSKGDVTGYLVLIFDVTEKKKANLALKMAEEFLHTSQKREALGRFADGIAHEFNSILTIVYNQSKYGSADNEGSIQDIYSAVNRGQELTRRLLTFSRKRIVDVDLISVDSVISNMKDILQNSVKKETTLFFTREENPGIVRANQQQLEQMILNLIKNGDDAMPKGGTITISCGCNTIEKGRFPPHYKVTPGLYSYVKVKDTGNGIEKDIQEQIFDPFFTTKEIASHSGLGLSTVYGIVKQFKGHIDLQSNRGEGSVFTIFLPIYSPED